MLISPMAIDTLQIGQFTIWPPEYGLRTAVPYYKRTLKPCTMSSSCGSDEGSMSCLLERLDLLGTGEEAN